MRKTKTDETPLMKDYNHPMVRQMQRNLLLKLSKLMASDGAPDEPSVEYKVLQCRQLYDDLDKMVDRKI